MCSTHLGRSDVDGTVLTFVRKPTVPFRPPENPHVPMIMVGAGTGLAPFRGFLQERAALARRGVPVGMSLLFFGCRTPDQDFLYEDELRAYEAEGIVRLCTAFSRTGDERRYVQHAVAAEGDAVWELLQDGAAVYVCGNANTMAPAVRAAFAEVVAAHGGEPDAAAWLTGMRAQRRYLEEHLGRDRGGLAPGPLRRAVVRLAEPGDSARRQAVLRGPAAIRRAAEPGGRDRRARG